MIDRQKIQSLLTIISATLSAVHEHPVFEQVVECDSYYTMNDLTLGDAIQALNEIVDGMECINSSDIEFLEEISEGPLEECLKALSELVSVQSLSIEVLNVENDEMTVLDEKVEEITTGWGAGDSKYLCFYHTGFPFMKDSWGVDYSNSKEELLEKQWALFSIASLRDHVIGDETFRTVLNVLSTDPQIILCSDGEYRICGYSRSPWGWIVVPVKFNKRLYRQLSCECRRAKSRGYQLFRDNMIALDDDQFKLAQRVAREVYGLEIWDIGQIEEVNGEASCQNQ